MYEYKYVNEYNCSSKETCKTDIWNLEHVLSKNIKDSINSDAIFITADNKLLSWTSVQSGYNNIALNPSDWLSFMLRFTSRSKDEYSSFVELLKITPIKEVHFEPKQIEVITKILDNVVSDPINQENIIKNLYSNQYQDLKRTSNTRDIEDFAIKMDTMISKEISLLHDKDLNERDRLNQEQINIKDSLIDDLTIKLSKKNFEISEINDKLTSLGDYVDVHQQNNKNKKLFLDNRKKLRNKWIGIIMIVLAIYITSRTFVGKLGAPQTLIGVVVISFIINYVSDKTKSLNIITTKEYRLSKKMYLEFEKSNNL